MCQFCGCKQEVMCGALGAIQKPVQFLNRLGLESKTLKMRVTPPEPDRAAWTFNTLKVQLKKVFQTPDEHLKVKLL